MSSHALLCDLAKVDVLIESETSFSAESLEKDWSLKVSAVDR